MLAKVRKVDVRLPGKWQLKSHGARPVHPILKLMRWTRTSRLSAKKSLAWPRCANPTEIDTQMRVGTPWPTSLWFVKFSKVTPPL